MDKWYRSGDQLLEEIESMQTGSGELALWFLGQCGFAFKYAGRLLLIDPVLNDITGPDGLTRKHYGIPFAPEQLQPDWVLCTHGHIDHLAEGTARSFGAAGVSYIVPAGCSGTAKALGVSQLLPMTDGMQVTLPGTDITVTAFSAAHPNHVDDRSDPDMALGYRISFGGITVTHLGDTYLTERLLHSLEALGAPNIFLPPINGDDRFRAMRNCIGNMEAEEAARLAHHLGADLSIPTHYDMIFDNNVDPLRFPAQLRQLSPSAKWKIPCLGERVIYRV